MKKIILFLCFLISVTAMGQQQTVTHSITPALFEETTSITITINGNSVNESTWGVTNNALYIWAWSFDINDANIQDCPTNGQWINSNEANKFTYNSGNDTYTFTMTPTTFYNRVGIGRIGFLVKAKNGTGDKKSQDILTEVGAFQVNLTAPLENSTTLLAANGSLNITANNTNGNAAYVLRANGNVLSTNASTSTFSFNHTGINGNQVYELEVTQGPFTITKRFSALVNPGTISQAMPANMLDGVNLMADQTKATLVLDAPGKDFVYVAGSFNNWQPTAAHAMRRDSAPGSTKFWLTLENLTPGENILYQYWVVDTTPINNSPSLVRTADPYSTLVISNFDDPWIPSSKYPNIPAYPAGQNREITVFKTNPTAYNWQVTNFVKPKKEDLVIYELLVRDFDSNRSYQDLIDKMDYFVNLKINAIQLMPVMEFEGNESWGYNTSFHMALDKFYGTADKFKEFVDLCHQNGIAVILDIALNHAFGRNPMVRMWMNDPDGDGWGDPSSENPYFNTQALHSYNVGSDFNHQQSRTRNYVKRVVKHWIEEFKVDGFRWDLTKGFTQNCPPGNNQESCTNAYQQDRVDVLKEYADFTWSLDPTHLAIFEHLGSDGEEQQWANYRINENPSKGVMMWGELTFAYSQLAGGYSTDAYISRVGHNSRGFAAKRLIGYPESHDKERVMYSARAYGNGGGAFPPLNNLTNTLSRAASIGATSLLVPGPKMIWHFAELGCDDSIYTCTNGTVNTDFDVTAGDCKLDTKPQYQWTDNWLGSANRGPIYQAFKRLIELKINEPVFEGDYAISPDGNNIRQRIYIFNNALPTTQLRNVVVLANFSVAQQNINPSFPFTGTWYNLMDNTQLVVTNTTAPISIPAGGFRVYGNQQALLNVDSFEDIQALVASPNPTTNSFALNKAVADVQIYNIRGQQVKSFSNSYDAEFSFDISDLTPGIYIVKATDAFNRTSSVKLVKN